MTRGKFVYVKDDKIYVSCEFNGDMYYENGHGPEVVERLQRVTDYDSLVKEVTEFDKENFGYAKDNDGSFGIYDYTLKSCGDKIDCKKSTYFDKWFSDYLYVKNDNGKALTVLDYDKNEHVINPGEIVVLCFGKFEYLVGSDGKVFPYGEKSEDEDNESSDFEETTIQFTFTPENLDKLYREGYFYGLPPTESELQSALDRLIREL